MMFNGDLMVFNGDFNITYLSGKRPQFAMV